MAKKNLLSVFFINIFKGEIALHYHSEIQVGFYMLKPGELHFMV